MHPPIKHIVTEYLWFARQVSRLWDTAKKYVPTFIELKFRMQRPHEQFETVMRSMDEIKRFNVK